MQQNQEQYSVFESTFRAAAEKLGVDAIELAEELGDGKLADLLGQSKEALRQKAELLRVLKLIAGPRNEDPRAGTVTPSQLAEAWQVIEYTEGKE